MFSPYGNLLPLSLALALILSACSGLSSTANGGGGQASDDVEVQTMDYDAKIGQQVAITGTASNAVLGAIVLTDDGTPIYIDGLASWDRATLKKTVTATGTLRERLLAPRASTNERGEVSHGVDGTNYVLEDANISVQ